MLLCKSISAKMEAKSGGRTHTVLTPQETDLMMDAMFTALEELLIHSIKNNK